MARARKEDELAVRIGNRPGELARLWSIIAAQDINILAYCAYSERDEGCVRLITGDAERARAALETAGYRCKTDPVVVVRALDKIGAAASLGRHLGEAGINILYSYASSSGQQFYAVFKTDNDGLAAQVLEQIMPPELNGP